MEATKMHITLVKDNQREELVCTEFKGEGNGNYTLTLEDGSVRNVKSNEYTYIHIN